LVVTTKTKMGEYPYAKNWWKRRCELDTDCNGWNPFGKYIFTRKPKGKLQTLRFKLLPMKKKTTWSFRKENYKMKKKKMPDEQSHTVKKKNARGTRRQDGICL